MVFTTEKKVIGLFALALTALAVYQGVTGGITAKGPLVEAVGARMKCADALGHVRDIRNRLAAGRTAEPINSFMAILEGCRANRDLGDPEIRELWPS
ncbi:hypothetical protein FJ937_16725 [Mesorhizobium sp. B2-4-4]|uniref:hypothetical protein n=1 Tax=Mesorhizobium sp. B2-4-4 TaxID=2589945 RepID=UPI001129FCD6|nr:hypothetical protein [Mesorhizobium sp. B2-4-4]TPL49129.1 hypothetical protein FJ937_16725 [Mesorhizobium sp. B2-4-4]